MRKKGRYRIGYEWRNQRGQVYIYMPDSIMRRTDGFVARSRLVMASMIDRPLTDIERVYHKDEVMDNDDPDNLQLFPSQAALIQNRSTIYRAKHQIQIKEETAQFLEKANRHREATREGMRKAGRLK